MNNQITKKLLTITHEEIEILKKQKKHTDFDSYIIQGNELFVDEGISVRKSTRHVKFHEHKHNFIEISIGLIGNISHVINDNLLTVNKYDVLVMNRNVVHVINQCSERDIALNLLIYETYIQELLQSYTENSKIQHFVNELFYSDKYTYLFKKSIDECLVNDINSFLNNLYFNNTCKELIKDNLRYIITSLFRLVSENQANENSITELSKESINEYVNQNYSTASLTDLAKSLDVEYSKLSKKIKEITGSNFKDIVQEKRLLVAENLLLYSKLSVKDISNQVGYENYTYFYKIFTTKYSMTPMEYRKNNSN